MTHTQEGAAHPGERIAVAHVTLATGAEGDFVVYAPCRETA